jgi:hypothetical protein
MVEHISPPPLCRPPRDRPVRHVVTPGDLVHQSATLPPHDSLLPLISVSFKGRPMCCLALRCEAEMSQNGCYVILRQSSTSNQFVIMAQRAVARRDARAPCPVRLSQGPVGYPSSRLPSTIAIPCWRSNLAAVSILPTTAGTHRLRRRSAATSAIAPREPPQANANPPITPAAPPRTAGTPL